ncbi:MAG: chloride channel protein [Bacteroidales bacterium]|nr:chloride channel protein [Bacteroidales bacterium]
MTETNFLGRFLVWKNKHLQHKQFVYILSLFIGIISGLAAVLLKNVVHYTQHFLIHRLPADNKLNFLYLFFPFAGIVLTVLFVKFLVKDKIGHGVSRILFAISKRNGIMRPHNNYSSFIASIFTVGFGGSVGLEAPIVLTGSSVGSTLGRIFKMNYKTTIILIGCGAAGAIAGIFKAPIAAVIFALEVLMLDLTLWSIIPLLISAVTALVISYFFLGKAEIFTFELATQFELARIPYYIILGVFCGLASYYFTRGNVYIESLFSRVKKEFVKPLIGGLLLGLVILFLPPLYGEGYNTLDALLNGNPVEITYGSLFFSLQDNILMFGLFLLLIMIFKVVATAVTNGAGGVGGIFAPTLFMGGIAGYFVARVINLFSFAQVSERNFSLVGMAGMMAGVMHAPLTAIFLIAEITGGYGLLLPLIITSTIAFITIMYFEPHSIYTMRLAQRGELITHHKDKAVLTLIEMGKVIEKDFIELKPTDKLTVLINAISKSKRNIFPVISNEMLVGIVLLDDIRHIIFNTDMHETTFVRDVMILPPAHVSPDEPMDAVMKKFEDTASWNLPVINNGRYIGFLSKSKLFSVYRKWLIDISSED